MSSNIPNQNIATVSNSVEFASRQSSSSLSGTVKPQRTQHDQVNTSFKNRSVKPGRGRARKGKMNSGSDSTEETASHVVTSPKVHRQKELLASNTNSNDKVVGYKPSSSKNGGSNGKYRQRQQTNQLLDGITPVSGIDIDIAESIVPTSSSGKLNEAYKGRHSTNSRKVNLTHLLNYKFEHTQATARYSSMSIRDERSSSYNRNSKHHYRDSRGVHKFSKQQFLQANGQFIVLEGYDYSIHKVDPDWPVDWDCIEEIRFRQSASSETTCPICLEPPIAAKITRCGHIYCWTCMLQYLSLSDESSRACPICFEFIHKNELRSVISQSFANHSVNEEITMLLMMRKKGCVEVEPFGRDHRVNDFCNEEQSIQDIQHYSSQANLVIVDSSTVISRIVQRERDELLLKLELDKNEPEVCFVEQALVELEKRVEKLKLKIIEESKRKAHNQVNIYKQGVSSTASELSKSYLFYQCSDGQHIYLSPFSTKVLCQEYENLENCPQEIRANILQMDWISMNDVWRKRFKYLEHLPLTCEFRLIEIDFEKSNLISEQTFKLFEDQIRKREQERAKRRKEERKREKIIQVEQNRRIYGIQPSLKINLDNIEQFPSVTDERITGLTQQQNLLRDDELVSSDDETIQDEPENRIGVGSTRANAPNPTSSFENLIPDVTLSFRDIQLQQASEFSNLKQASSSSPWGKKIPGSSSQTSFAQLLVGAKSSQKEWVRKCANSSSSASTVPSNSKNNQPHTTSVSDNEDDEQRLPPPEFTIGDFIDITLASGKKKGRSKNALKRN